MNRISQFVLFLTTLVVIVSVSSSELQGQTEGDDYDAVLINLRKAIEKDQNGRALNLGNPQIDDLVAIAERAERRIFTQEDNELRRLARDSEQKLLELQTNDMGKWVAQRPVMVEMFSQFDSDQIELSDWALERRRTRLAESITALKNYDPAIQGVFEARTNELARIILTDANWVEDKYTKLTDRQAVLADIETKFPKTNDWSKSPTLREVKNNRNAERMVKAAELAKKAADEASNRIAQSNFDRQVRKAKSQIAADDMLAELEMNLMKAEYGRRATEIERQIMDARLAKKKIELQTELAKSNAAKEMATMVAENKDEKLAAYLSSDRVKALLAPFCAAGRCEATTGNSGYKRIDALEDGPMSYNRIGMARCLAPNDPAMRNLIKVANFSGNERPSWGTSEYEYNNAGKDFDNIDGDKVNRYIEAQRILREHGAKLVELKILRR